MPDTPLQLLERLSSFTGRDTRHTPEWSETFEALKAFLSEPTILVMGDPGPRAAVAVLLTNLPEVIRLRDMTLQAEWAEPFKTNYECLLIKLAKHMAQALAKAEADARPKPPKVIG